jgi:hypothetical protein
MGMASAWMSQQANTAFDLETGPLTKAALLRVGHRRYCFYFSVHHIVADGISIDIVFRELLSIYNSLAAGAQFDLEPLRIQYKDFAAWQNRSLTDGRYMAHREYWLKKLGGPLPLLDLPLDQPRKENRGYEGQSRRFVLSAGLTQALKELNKEQESTVFITVMAVLKLMLYGYSGQNDILVGSPVSGREHPDLSGQVGLYLNNIVFRNTVNPADTFLVFLQTVKDTAFEAYEHQSYPFDHLVEDLNLSWPRNRNALYDVLLVMDNVDAADQTKIDGLLKASDFINGMEVPLHYHTSKLDLTFFISQIQETAISVEYNSGLYKPATIGKMLKNFEILLQEAVTHPARKVGALMEAAAVDLRRDGPGGRKGELQQRISEEFGF